MEYLLLKGPVLQCREWWLACLQGRHAFVECISLLEWSTWMGAAWSTSSWLVRFCQAHVLVVVGVREAWFWIIDSFTKNRVFRASSSMTCEDHVVGSEESCPC